MYELIRSLNTNVALVKDTNNQQAVVMGLRVGFIWSLMDVFSWSNGYKDVANSHKII
ncbi:CAT RNA binding domain-containing protein [Streptococcus jiangjianxini]|uniref:CAT RNA binding domain-containing protein n=1 Tax=Streptococcus jiangjianxini TaxID=3161189 RepID=UPI0032EFDB99